MKKALLPLFLTVTGLAFTACATTTPINVKPYPKDTCIVSENELGSMGPPITKVHGDQEVKFCCQPCIKKFDENPQRYLSNL